jgi:MFS family permease
MRMKKSIFPGWWQVVVAMLNQATGSGAIIMCYSVIVVPLEKEFAPSRQMLMLVMTALYLVHGVINPPIGMAMDRYSIRKIMLGGVLLLSGGFLAISMATSMIQVILIYSTIMAVAQVSIGPLAYSVHLSRWFARRQARAMGMATLGVSIGGAILPLVLQYLINEFDWRTALRIFGGILFVLTVPAITWLVIDRPSDVGLYPDGDPEPPVSVARQSEGQFATTASVLRDRNFWVISIIVSIVMSGSTSYISSIVPFALAKGLTANQGALGVSCVATGCFISMGLYAGLGDKLGPRVGLSICALAYTLSSAAYYQATSLPLFLTGALLEGLSIGLLQPLWSVIVARVFGPASMGRVFGLMTLVMTPFVLLSPPLVGRIFDHTGSYDDAFIMYFGACLATLLLVPLIRTGAERTEPSPAMG